MTKCEVCGVEVLMPFKCPYCGGYFCAQHRLPEKHDCPGLYAAASPYEKEWKERRIIRMEEEERISVRRRRMREELLHLVIGTLLVILVGFSLISYNFAMSWYILLIFTIGFASSFLIHELLHRHAARNYGLGARFKLDPIGAVLTMITAIPYIPFKIIAPGAVVVEGLSTIPIMGRIALAGPLSNIGLSAGFYIAAHIVGRVAGFGSLAAPWIPYVLRILASINAFIAFFNLIPFGQLDGRKIIAWSPIRWGISFIASIALMIVGYVG